MSGRSEDFFQAIINECIKPTESYKGGATQKIAWIQAMAEAALKEPDLTISENHNE